MRELEVHDRREFTLAAALAVLSGVTITISGCGGGGGSSPTTPSNPTPPLGPGDKAGSISANHGHTAVVTAAQLTAGAGITLELTVGDAHIHTVTLSAAEVTQIAGTARVSKESTFEAAHSHTVTFN